MTVLIYGYSDDHIVVERDGKKDEFNCYENDDVVRFLGFSDGTLLRVTYGVNDEAAWRITLVRQGSSAYSLQQVSVGKGLEEYSDKATLVDIPAIKWVVCSKDKPMMFPYLGQKPEAT